MERRQFFRLSAAASAVAAARALFPDITFNQNTPPSDPSDQGLLSDTDPDSVPQDATWQKTPCRFCGVGCGLLVAVADGKAVAVKGDPASPVNRGLCCVKGYHTVLALYGSDRLKQAYVRKNGTLTPVPISEALDLVASKMKGTIEEHGKDSVAIYGSGQWTIPDGYVASKFMKGGSDRTTWRGTHDSACRARSPAS